MFLHIDIDCFFASAERSFNAKLKNIPIAVGSRSNLEIFNPKRLNTKIINNNSGAFVAPVFYSDKKRDFESYFVDDIDGVKKIRGIITTASYEARAFGVKTAMSISQALSLCPHLLVLPSNYPLYHKLSFDIHRYIASQIPKVEQFSIDEFFGQTDGWIAKDDVYEFAKDLQYSIKKKFDIPVSIGISKAKWISKLATKYAKPYGVYEVNDIDRFIQDIPISMFPGIGKGFERRLNKYYIKTLGEIKQNKKLLYSWKKPGRVLYHRVTGTCNEGIEPKSDRKSIGISRTFDAIYDSSEVKRRVMIMARHVAYIVSSIGVNPSSIYLKIKYEHNQRVKSTKTINRIFSESVLKHELGVMYDEIALRYMGAIKLSVSVSNFIEYQHKTLSLLDIHSDRLNQKIDKSLYMLREKFGLDIIKTANELG
jgi:DNA polymerase-4